MDPEGESSLTEQNAIEGAEQAEAAEEPKENGVESIVDDAVMEDVSDSKITRELEINDPLEDSVEVKKAQNENTHNYWCSWRVASPLNCIPVWNLKKTEVCHIWKARGRYCRDPRVAEKTENDEYDDDEKQCIVERFHKIKKSGHQSNLRTDSSPHGKQETTREREGLKKTVKIQASGDCQGHRMSGSSRIIISSGPGDLQ